MYSFFDYILIHLHMFPMHALIVFFYLFFKVVIGLYNSGG